MPKTSHENEHDITMMKRLQQHTLRLLLTWKGMSFWVSKTSITIVCHKPNNEDKYVLKDAKIVLAVQHALRDTDTKKF